MADKNTGKEAGEEAQMEKQETRPEKSKETAPGNAQEAQPGAKAVKKASEKKQEKKEAGEAGDQKEKVDDKSTAQAEEKPAVLSPEKLNHLGFFPSRRDDLPDIHPGDIIDIAYLIQEGGKEKVQHYKGTVIALKGVGISRTMTVRKISFGIGVERIFPLNSKYLRDIKIVRRSKVRRSKLYYLRKLRGKASRLKPMK